MGLLGFLFNLFSCSDSKSGFKPGVLSARGYYVNAGKVYFYGGFSNASVIELKEANAQKFEVFDQRLPGNEHAAEYAGDDKVVYYAGKLIEGADPETFQVLGYGLGKDANAVFSRQSVLSRDPANFIKIEGYLYKDSQHAYRGDYIVSDDPANLTYIGRSGNLDYFKDSKGIIANGIRIDSVDVNSFVALDHGYSRDKFSVFLLDEARLQKIENADAGSFRVLSSYYTKDQFSVFWRGIKLPNVNAETFRIISDEHHCSCDDRNVYHHNKIIPNASPTRFPAGKRFKYCNDSEIVFE